MVSVGNYWLHGEACYFFHFSLLCSQLAGSWATNRILRFSMRSRSPETTTVIKVGSGFALEASSAFCIQNFLKGSTGSQKGRKWKCYPDCCFPPEKNPCSFEIAFFFSEYWCKQTTIQLYFLFCDVKCHNPSQSFKKCHDTHKNSQLCCWNNPDTFLSLKTLCYTLHEKLLQIHVSEVLPSVNPGSYDIAGLTLVNFTSNWNNVKCLALKSYFKYTSVQLTTKAEFFIVMWNARSLFRSLCMCSMRNNCIQLFKMKP